jgi:hypothetical protein
MRARREAERKAQVGGSSSGDDTPAPPLALSDVLPDLPPRVKPPSDTQEENAW